MAATERSEPGHYAYIDTVRGLAFLGVLAIHAAIVAGPFPGRNLLLQGNFGVQLFFLASAVTLCHSMAARQAVDKCPVGFFYLRRLFRIAPLFWLAMIFYWTWPGSIPATSFAQSAPAGVQPAYFVLTTLFLHGWHPYTFNSIVPGGWSIAVEMTFYAFFPLFFYALKSLTKTAVAVALGIGFTKLAFHFIFPQLRQHVYAGTPDVIWNFFVTLWFPTQFNVFLIGFLTYHLLQRTDVQARMQSKLWSGGLLAGGGAALVGLMLYGAGNFMPAYFLIIFALAGMVIAISGKAQPWLVNPVLCQLGKISYSCYLVHFAALGLTLRWLGVQVTAAAPAFEAGSAAGNFWFFLKVITLTLLLTAALATLTLHLIENPGIALGKKIIRRISATLPAK